jgi:fatty-acid peroxygenase
MRTKTALAILVGSAGAALVARILATDRTLALLSESYTLIPERCRRLGIDVFESRIMLKKVVCMTGEEATRVRPWAPLRATCTGLRVVAHT